MRIGILTLPLHTNYGGILQAYALQTVLERMGHEVCLIEKRRKPLRLPLWKAPLVYGKRIAKNIVGHPFPIFYEQKINKERHIVQQYTDKFINRYIKRRIVEDYSDINETDFDAIVVGSDQVWRPKYFHEIEHAFLDFTEGWNIKRIAYAASFGTDEWEYSKWQTKKCKKLIKLFDIVSIREIFGIKLCREHFGVEAKQALDPTMLLTQEDYIRLLKNTNTFESKGNLLIYILDETSQKTDLINKIVKEEGLVPFNVNSKVGNPNVSLEERIQLPVEQWLRGFYDAKFVITDSFHACVFSILFNKPFLAICNVDRGLSRFLSLLSMFGLEKRMITKCSCDTKSLESIDWNKINIILNNKTCTSIQLLK